MNNNILLNELFDNQLKNIQNNYYRLDYDDLKRVLKYINGSIFDIDNCCLWNGFITNNKNTSVNPYIYFYFKNRKISIRRLLYINYKGSLDVDEYLIGNCINNTTCCNIHHMRKLRYKKLNQRIINNNIKLKQKYNINIIINDNLNNDKFKIYFD